MNVSKETRFHFAFSQSYLCHDYQHIGHGIWRYDEKVDEDEEGFHSGHGMSVHEVIQRLLAKDFDWLESCDHYEVCITFVEEESKYTMDQVLEFFEAFEAWIATNPDIEAEGPPYIANRNCATYEECRNSTIEYDPEWRFPQFMLPEELQSMLPISIDAWLREQMYLGALDDGRAYREESPDLAIRNIIAELYVMWNEDPSGLPSETPFDVETVLARMNILANKVSDELAAHWKTTRTVEA